MMKKHGIRIAGDLTADEIEAVAARRPNDASALAAELKVSVRGLLLRMEKLGLRGLS